MRQRFLTAIGVVLCAAGPAFAQQVSAGVAAGPSWPTSETGSGSGTGLGAEGWVGLELPGVPVIPRVTFAVDRFTDGGRSGSQTMRGGRLDLLADLPTGSPLDAFVFMGVGAYHSDYSSFGSSGPPLGWVGTETALAAGVGTRIGLGRFRGVAEARYLGLMGPGFGLFQLRLGASL